MQGSPDTQLRLDGYVRVSTTRGREGESFVSPQQQIDAITGWAAFRNVEILGGLAEPDWDLDKTGSKLERLERIVDRVRRGESDGIAVAKLDRLSRASVMDALKVCGEIIEAGGKVAAIDIGVDPTTPTGEFVMTVFLAIARMEWRRYKDNFRDVRGRAARRKLHMGKTPFGYVRHGRRDARGYLLPGENPPTEVDPQRGPVVTELFKRRAAGEGWYTIWQDFKARGVTTPNGQLINRKHLRRIVENEVYLGIVDDPVSGVRTEDAHPPLTDYATWRAAQSAPGGPYKAADPDTFLNGLVRCAGCRYTLRTQRNSQYGGIKVVYACDTNGRKGGCDQPAYVLAKESIRAHYLDKAAARKAAMMVEVDGLQRKPVAEQFGIGTRQLDQWRTWWKEGRFDSIEPEYRGLDEYVIAELLNRKLPEIAMRRAADQDDQLDELRAAMESAQLRLGEFATDSDLEEALGRDAYLARGRKLREDYESAEAAYSERFERSQSRVDEAVRRLRDNASLPPGHPDGLSVDEWRQFLGTLVRCVFVGPPLRRGSQEPLSAERVRVVWFDEAEVDLPVRGKAWTIRPFEFGADADPHAAVAAA